MSHRIARFQELSKRGIKLIYHQAPAYTCSDWTQPTVKLFLRTGQCHEKEMYPIPAVKQALQKEGKDLGIIDMDPEKPYASQIKDKPPIKADGPLKDDPEYSKFFKVRCIVLNAVFRREIGPAHSNSQYVKFPPLDATHGRTHSCC
jgi:hypothetical protein